MFGIGVITTSWTFNTREFDIPHWFFAWGSGTLYFCFGAAAGYACYHTGNKIHQETYVENKPVNIVII